MRVLRGNAPGVGGHLFIERLQRCWQITTGVQDSPDVDLVIADDVEHDIGEASQWPCSKFWDTKFVREVERADVRAATDTLNAALDSVDELERSLVADVLAVVGAGAFEVGCRELA